MNKVYNFNNIISTIVNKEYCSIDELSEIASTPIKILNKNLDLLQENQGLFTHIPEYDIDFENEDTHKACIIQCTDTRTLLNLNLKEKNMMEAVLKHKDKNDLMGIKTKSLYDISFNERVFTQIGSAINDCRILKILYKVRNNNEATFFIEPLGIVFYEFENIFYIIGQYMGQIVTYRLDRIVDMKGTKEKFTPMEKFSVEKYLENIWGMEQGEQVRVKVKFLKEANVEYKVKRDVQCRKNKTITEFEKYFIYEDTVVGINSFKSWLRSYGSSAIVLEPQFLREELILSAKKALEYYKSSCGEE